MKLFIQQPYLNRESDINLSKIKQNKLNSIKSEIEEIKKYITSNDMLDESAQNHTDFSNNNENDTLTLTNVIKEENKVINNSDLYKIKNELIELKSAVHDNKDLLKQILSKIK